MVAATYNEPAVWAEYAMDIADACHAHGLKMVAVTSGYFTPQAGRIFRKNGRGQRGFEVHAR